jgi:hypothetical protein
MSENQDSQKCETTTNLVMVERDTSLMKYSNEKNNKELIDCKDQLRRYSQNFM